MLLPAIYEPHHIVATKIFFENNGLWLKMVGKMPTKFCVNADVVGGILPTLPSHFRAVSLSEPRICTD